MVLFTKFQVQKVKYNHELEIQLSFSYLQHCDALRGLVPFLQFKKQENTHRRVLILIK